MRHEEAPGTSPYHIGTHLPNPGVEVEVFVGVDPGKSGAISVLGFPVAVSLKLASASLHDVSDFLGCLEPKNIKAHACLEKVHAMPGQGVSSTFKFGQSYGGLEMALACHLIPFDYVTPQTWQKAMGCLSGGDKKITRAAAQRLFPDIRVTHATADSLLIAEYCRRQRLAQTASNGSTASGGS